MWFWTYARRQTDRQTRSSQYFASPIGDEVINSTFAKIKRAVNSILLSVLQFVGEVEQSQDCLAILDP